MTATELTKIREEKTLSKAAFAKSIGITPMMQGRYESGKIAIPDSIAEKILSLYASEPEKNKAEKAEKKPAKKTVKKATEKKEPVKKAAKEKKATAAVAKTSKAKKTSPLVLIESLMGGTITPEEVLKRIPKDAETVYIKPEENKAYWVKGDESGSVDLW